MSKFIQFSAYTSFLSSGTGLRSLIWDWVAFSHLELGLSSGTGLRLGLGCVLSSGTGSLIWDWVAFGTGLRSLIWDWVSHLGLSSGSLIWDWVASDFWPWFLIEYLLNYFVDPTILLLSTIVALEVVV
ncbi:hypothetical protein MANES_10G077241v8 [Manihot esculenta]|uniref:Uncharacterized protein n=1 Tax=Manihot esculenta TaxID=3983 RepID=A0ACB7H0H4_MANES|nr:hypothetical protein MANES_10G077241v8 [Manihot esculenta]